MLWPSGRFDEARAHYDQLATGTDSWPAARRSGKAQAQMRAGQFDPAIESLKTLSTAAHRRCRSTAC